MIGTAAGLAHDEAALSRLERIWPTLVGVIGIPVAVFILFFGGTYLGIANQPVRVLTQALSILGLATWLLVSMWVPRVRVRSPLAIPAILILAALWLSVFGSQRFRLSLEAGLTATVVTLGFLAVLAITRDDQSRRRLGLLVVGAALFVGIGYLLEVGTEWVRWWDLVGRVSVPPLRPGFSGLTLGSPNLIATYLLMLGPLATAILWRLAGRAPAMMALALFLLGILLSGSRGGFLGLGAGVVSAAGLLLLAGTDSWTSAIRRLAVQARSPRIAGPAVAILVIGAVVIGPAVVARFGTGGEALRLNFWQTAMQLFQGHPWLGTGPGTWPQLQLGINQPADLVLVVPHPHNAYVRLLSELGILGVAAVLTLFGVLAARVTTVLRMAEPRRRIESIAAVAGLVGLGAQCLVDDLTNMPGVVLMAILLVSWLDAAEPGRGPDAAEPGRGPGGAIPESGPIRRPRLSRVISASPVLVAGVLILAAPAVGRMDVAAIVANQGDDAADRGDWTAAADAYRRALELDGDLAFYHVELGLALANTGDVAGARAEYDQALVTDTLPENAVALATLDAAAGDITAAMVRARDATARAGRDPNVFVNAGRVAEQAGDTGAATTWYARAVAINPAIARNPALAVRASLRTAAIQAAIADAVGLGNPARAALTAAYGGDLPAARALLAGMTSSPMRDLMDNVVDWLAGNRTAADAALRARLTMNPLDFEAAGWLAQFLSVEGDPGAARYLEWTDALRGDAAPEVVYEYSRLPGVGVDRALSRWSNYPDAIYLRHGPLDLLPPQAVVVGINRGG